jgi:2-amino-4-hydroxy-6-hydroxymethyldihydropteridine diphosphokinase
MLQNPAGKSTEMNRIPVYIGIGTNMGDPFQNTLRALNNLDDIENTELVEHSSLYWTNPIGPENQDPYLNSVALLKTGLEPGRLLNATQCIEQKCGRQRIIRWGPRILDLDILFYNLHIVQTDDLIIPHPRFHERLFAMVPLLEITPDFRHPGLNGSLSTYLEDLHGNQIINMGYKRVPGSCKQFIPVKCQ